MCEVLAAIIARKWVVAEASVEREREVFTVLRFAEHFDQVEST